MRSVTPDPCRDDHTPDRDCDDQAKTDSLDAFVCEEFQRSDQNG